MLHYIKQQYCNRKYFSRNYYRTITELYLIQIYLLLCFNVIIFNVLAAQDFIYNSVENDINNGDGNRTHINLFKNSITTAPTTFNHVEDEDHLVCPGQTGTDVIPLSFLAIPCETHYDCQRIFGSVQQRCCQTQPSFIVPFTTVTASQQKRCIKGVPRPKPELPHTSWFGRIRECPQFATYINEKGENQRASYAGYYYRGSEPLAEIFNNDVRECTEDSQCWPFRICCSDRVSSSESESSEVKSYCRAPAPNLNALRFPAFRAPLENILGYMQCTPPPPPFLDLFPKPCRNSFDCFPNLCCQEQRGKRFCRPPKRSVLAIIAGFTQTLGAAYRQRFLANQKPSMGLE